jgi:hypothetical protein
VKKLVLLLVIGLNAFLLHAQQMYPYSFSTRLEPYVPLTASTPLTAGVVWDDTLLTIPIGFTFKWALNNRNLDTILFDTYGIMSAPADYTVTTFFPDRVIAPYIADLCDRSFNVGGSAVSPISYSTSGVVGNRICKLEIKNAGMYNDISGTDVVNFQIWLYEGSNIIEFHYGYQSVTDIPNAFDGDDGPRIGLYYETTIDLPNFDFFIDTCSYVKGDSATAGIQYSTSQIDFYNPPGDFPFNGLPGNGQVFRFTPNTANSIPQEANLSFQEVRVFPTPFDQDLSIQHDGQLENYVIRDMHGRTIRSGKLSGRQATLDMSSFRQGNYLLTLIHRNMQQKSFLISK